ncbi:phenoloxidase-activating factor 2-like [Drosophila subpulchrella]|uniref:phenoloxidase-activating factor 2-like n=1 Tax=Drosophila subpulchrella TaxID=1486046 RepID=UPI0018A1996A|nr:phenoloxidase-activating factor 2-like [Drosophila subpulchrella]
MTRFWVIGIVLLGCFLLGNACKHCVSKEQCLEEKPLTNARGNDCPPKQICCKTLRGSFNWIKSEEQVRPTKISEVLVAHSKERLISRDQQLCGLSNANGLDFRQEVTEDQSRPGQYPWVVALFSNNEYFSGGSLIAPHVVLTTAHRLVYKTAEDIMVRAGEWDLDSEEEDFAFEEREVKRITIHEKFHFPSGANNLALLFLYEPYELKKHIRTICLTTPLKSYDGRRCIVAGWGKRKFEDLDNSAILKKVDLPVLNKNTCQEQLRNTTFGFNYQLPESFICTGSGIGHVCSGDGGSALFCPVGGENSHVYEQIGIVNWSVKSGQTTYTDVGMFRTWIAEQVLGFVN